MALAHFGDNVNRMWRSEPFRMSIDLDRAGREAFDVEVSVRVGSHYRNFNTATLDRDPIHMNRSQSRIACLSMIFRECRYPSFRIMRRLSAPADSRASSTCLGGVGATGKLPRDISTLIR